MPSDHGDKHDAAREERYAKGIHEQRKELCKKEIQDPVVSTNDIFRAPRLRTSLAQLNGLRLGAGLSVLAALS